MATYDQIENPGQVAIAQHSTVGGLLAAVGVALGEWESRVAVFDAQTGREVSADSELTRAQVISDEVDLADGLRGLAEPVVGGRSLNGLLVAVAGFAAQAIPGVDGAGVTLIRPIGTTMGIATWAVTAPFVREVDLIQYEGLQEGPCITCMQERVAVVSGSLASDPRWPRFGSRMGRLGVASSLSLPLLIAEQVAGSINCYAYDTDVFGEHAVRLGSQFAGPAAVSVYNAQVMNKAQAAAAHLQHALVSRAVIDQAIGIIRARSGRTAEGSVRLVAAVQSYREHRTARDSTSDGRERGTPRPRPTYRRCRPGTVTGTVRTDSMSSVASRPGWSRGHRER